jgi:hypothetical protein
MARLDRTSKTQPSSRSTRFSEILKLKQIGEDTVPEPEQPSISSADAAPDLEQTTELPEPEPSTSPLPEPEKSSPSQQERSQPKAKSQSKGAKRGNPDYMQAIFYIPIKSSKRLDRELLDLGEAGVECDRSEFIEELLQNFFQLSAQVGAAEALSQLKKLGSE